MTTKGEAAGGVYDVYERAPPSFTALRWWQGGDKIRH